MVDIITDDERRVIQRALRENLGATWKEVSSENSRDGKEAYFWIKVRDQQHMQEIAQRCLDIVSEAAAKLDGVEFMMSFLQLTVTSIISWERLIDREIRAGFSSKILGLNPRERRRDEYTVFDRDI